MLIGRKLFSNNDKRKTEKESEASPTCAFDSTWRCCVVRIQKCDKTRTSDFCGNSQRNIRKYKNRWPREVQNLDLDMQKLPVRKRPH